jgi:hypothetical protein
MMKDLLRIIIVLKKITTSSSSPCACKVPRNSLSRMSQYMYLSMIPSMKCKFLTPCLFIQILNHYAPSSMFHCRLHIVIKKAFSSPYQQYCCSSLLKMLNSYSLDHMMVFQFSIFQQCIQLLFLQKQNIILCTLLTKATS